MSIKIDLRIFLFGVLFFWTKQIEIYATIMFFAFLHEIAHLCAGLALGFKPKTMKITPVGFQIAFKTKIEDYHKKIVLYLAGPMINFLLILVCFLWKTELMIPKETIIYSNLLLAIFNLLPIPPLDGSKILLGILDEETYFKFLNYEYIISIALVLVLATGAFDGILGNARGIFLDAFTNISMMLLGI